MSSLTNILSDIVGSAFERLGLDKKLGAVRVSDRLIWRSFNATAHWQLPSRQAKTHVRWRRPFWIPCLPAMSLKNWRLPDQAS
ncbi:MAG: hypothetical protein LRZ85_04665 [Alphaproteobacteria bacterium]|nr:hypothetical protein [Alphaproteobacteria bacterium]